MANRVDFKQLHLAIQRLNPSKAKHGMCHSIANQNLQWDDVRRASFSADFLKQRFALQLRDEKHKLSGEKRAIIFCQRLLPKTTASYNTARGTFNSRNLRNGSYFIRPQLKNVQRIALMAEFQNQTTPPIWRDNHIDLGGGSAESLLKSFLRAVIIVENIKSQTAEELRIQYEETYDVRDLAVVSCISEGRMTRVTQTRRERSELLRKQAICWFKRQSDDAKLHCRVCDWAKPDIPITGDIVEIDHVESLSNYPSGGKRFGFTEAIKRLCPLCPNCHRMMHRKEGGGKFSAAELHSLLAKGDR